MKNWYELTMFANESMKDSLVTDVADLKGFAWWDFQTGRRIENWNKDAFLKASQPENDGTPDDALATAFFMPVYSNRLQNAIVDAGIDGVQFLPIKVFRPDDSLVGGFAIANILNVLPALDLVKSNFMVFDEDFPNKAVRGHIKWARKVVLRNDIVEPHDIIRIENYEVPIFVSEKFRKIFQKNKCTGIRFTKVEVE